MLGLRRPLWPLSSAGGGVAAPGSEQRCCIGAGLRAAGADSGLSKVLWADPAIPFNPRGYAEFTAAAFVVVEPVVAEAAKIDAGGEDVELSGGEAADELVGSVQAGGDSGIDAGGARKSLRSPG